MHPVELIVDRLLQSEGRELYNVWFFNRAADSLADYLQLDHVAPGLGDAGAHVGQILDASQPTFFLSYWVRERGLVGIGEGVRRMTSDTARFAGLLDRGVLRPGAKADANVVDLEALRLPLPTFARDFPGGAGRFVQRAEGYAWTVVNGEVFMVDGEHTGALAGRPLLSR